MESTPIVMGVWMSSRALADVQDGVCLEGVVKVCDGVNGWIEPDYGVVEGFELVESACDGVDSDCDANVDESLVCLRPMCRMVCVLGV